MSYIGPMLFSAYLLILEILNGVLFEIYMWNGRHILDFTTGRQILAVWLYSLLHSFISEYGYRSTINITHYISWLYTIIWK